MSRLADTLMGMDRRTSRPERPGGIPRLAASRGPKWRHAVVLVIVAFMVMTAGTFVMLRPRSAEMPVTPAPVPLPPAPVPLPRSVAASERVAALVGRGIKAAREGNLAEAAGLLREALAQNPTDAEAWNSLGVIQVRQGDTSRGVDAFRHALRVNPTHAETHRNLAVALDRQGKYGDAVIHYRAFLRLSSADDAGREEVRRRLTEVSASNPGMSELN